MGTSKRNCNRAPRRAKLLPAIRRVFFVTARAFRHAPIEISESQMLRLLSSLMTLSNNPRTESGRNATGDFGGACEGLGKEDSGCGRRALGRAGLCGGPSSPSG